MCVPTHTYRQTLTDTDTHAHKQTHKRRFCQIAEPAKWFGLLNTKNDVFWPPSIVVIKKDIRENINKREKMRCALNKVKLVYTVTQPGWFCKKKKNKNFRISFATWTLLHQTKEVCKNKPPRSLPVNITGRFSGDFWQKRCWERQSFGCRCGVFTYFRWWYTFIQKLN